MNKDIRKPEKSIRRAMSAAKRARAWGMNYEAKAYAAAVYQPKK